MLDRPAARWIQPALHALAARLVQHGVRANQITVAGFVLGLGAAGLIAAQSYALATLAMALSRLCDGLDGAVARQTTVSDAGGFLDITLDFLFYASIPLAFALANPPANALAAAVLLAAFIGTGSSFLAFAALAAKRQLAPDPGPVKSMYFLGGLTEASETLLCFFAMCLWPQQFAALAYSFAGLCAITIATRIHSGWKAFQ